MPSVSPWRRALARAVTGLVLGLSVLSRTVCYAQSTGRQPFEGEPRRELSPAVFVSLGQAKRHEPEYLSPAKPLIGAGVMLHLNRRMAAQFEFSQIVGLSLDTVSVTARALDCSSGQCVAGPSTRITGRDGTSSLWSVTGSAVLYLSSNAIQPFVSIGIGTIRQEGVWFWTGDPVRPAQEQPFRKTSLTIPLGAGVRVALPRGLFVAPEMKFQTASIKMNNAQSISGEPVGQWTWGRGVLRASVVAGYKW